jgi:hypothetical protein
MSKYDFDKAMLGAVADQAIKMQDDFLNQFVGTPRPLNIIERPSDAAELLQTTYRKLLEGVRDAVEMELGELQ